MKPEERSTRLDGVRPELLVSGGDENTVTSGTTIERKDTRSFTVDIVQNNVSA